MTQAPQQTPEMDILEEQLREHAASEMKLGNMTTEWFKNSEMEGIFGAGEKDAGVYAQMTTDREKVRLWNTLTGEPSDVLIYMVSKYLGRKRPDGKPFWTLREDQAPKAPRGTLMCLLHPDHPEREWLDSIGLQGRFCAINDAEQRHKANITSEFELAEHMRKKHRREWATIEREREKEEKEAEKDWQRRLMQTMTQGVKLPKKGPGRPRKVMPEG